MRRFVFFLLLACLPLSARAGEDTTIIVALGDSLFAGYGTSLQDSFPDQLEHRLKEDGYNVNIINMGQPGQTTAGGVTSVDRVLSLKPALILVSLGGNDMLRGMAPVDTKANLDRILARIHRAGVSMLVIGQKAPPSYGKDFVDTFDPLFCALAKKYDAPCYPFALQAAFGHPDLMQNDGLHPNPKGVRAMVDDMYPMITKLLKK